MSFLKELISLLFTYPKQALKSITLENLKTLLFALRHEPPKRIFHNITKKFRSNEVDKKILISLDDKSFQSTISINKSYLISDKYILLNGNVKPFDGISKMSLSDTHLESMLIEIQNGSFNKILEVGDGFQANDLKLTIEYNTGRTGTSPLTLEKNNDYHSLDLNLQYQIYRQQKTGNKKRNNFKQVNESKGPKFSIVIPTYNGDIKLFYECIDSLVNQTYKNIEICIYDDASTDLQFKEAIKNLSTKYSDIDIVTAAGTVNKGIAHATSQAIKLAQGSYISFMDQDDCLDTQAFSHIAQSINTSEVIPKLIYTDEDHIDQKGQHCDPIFKPSYSPTTLKSSNYINHLTTVLKSEGDKIGWLRPQFNGAQDYDLLLRITERCQSDEIIHIPKVLYHWRKSDNSIANRPEAKKYVYQSAKKALEDYLKRNDIAASVANAQRIGTYKINYQLSEEPLVSIIIPFKDQIEVLKTCVESIFKITSYKKYEIILVSNNSEQAETLSYCEVLSEKNSKISFFEHNVPFNYSEINNKASKKCKGEYLLFLNNDTEAINPNWLTEMVALLKQESIGVVGAKLLYPNNTIQHAGIILGMNGNAGYINKSVEDEVYSGYYMGIDKNVIACTGACLLTSRSLFDKLGGFDEELFKVNFNDVDYCLKVHQHGQEVVYSPSAILYHHESYTRGTDISKERKGRDRIEIKNLKTKWKHIFEEGDPFYNPNLSLYHEQLSLKLY